MSRSDRYAVFIPTAGTHPMIDPGSGIVSTLDALDAEHGARVLVDYEGNRYGSESMATYADRVHHAAGRHETRYPTVARASLPLTALLPVGTFDTTIGTISLCDVAGIGLDQVRERLAAWLGLPPADLDEQLSTRGSARHLMTREARAALSSHDPAQRWAAQHMVRRYQLDV